MGLKVGIFTDSYRPYNSGVVRSIETFSKELTAQGHELYIFAPSYRDCEKEHRVFRFASIPAPTNPDFSLAVPISLRLKPTIAKLDLDLIHVHSPFLLGRVGAKYAKRLNIPLVFTFHTLYDQYVHYVPFGKNLTRELTQKFCSDFANKCDLVVVPTKVVKQYLLKIGVHSPMEVIPTGIVLSDFEQNKDPFWLRKQYGIPPGEKVLLFVGRLGKEKNVPFLLEAFKELLENIHGVTLVLVGGGPEEETLKGLTEQLNINNKVLFTGNLSPQDVIKCYHGANLFVFPSITETQGLVIGEAKAAGLPVVAVNVFGVSEMVVDGEDGFLTEMKVEEFAKKISLLIKDDSLHSRMSNQAKINAKLMSSKNCALRLAQCYEELLGYEFNNTNNQTTEHSR